MEKKSKIKLAFVDFWGGFIPDNNYFFNLLSKHFNIELSKNPDFLIYSCFGGKHAHYNCTKIFYTGENVRPNYWETDFSISFDYPSNNGRNIRYPLYNLYGDLAVLLKLKDSSSIQLEKNKFCNMVVSNPKGKERLTFFKLLNQYKQVDSGGKVFNNVGGLVPNKREFIRSYKFTLAFENSSHPGYTTEKILEPMFENSIPIYWGNPKVFTDFNTKSFVNVHEFGSLKEAVEYVAFLDQNDDAYLSMLKEPWLPNNTLTQYCSEIELIKFFEKVFNHKYSKVIGVLKNVVTSYNEIAFKAKYRINKKGKWNG